LMEILELATSHLVNAMSYLIFMSVGYMRTESGL
jgi:hypothetical protein